MRVFLIILGILMLLPGACGLIVTMMELSGNGFGGVLALSLPCLAIGIGGIFLITSQVRKRDGADEEPKS